MTISIFVNRKLLEMKSTIKQENNRTSKRTVYFSFICSSPILRGLQQRHISDIYGIYHIIDIMTMA